MAKGHKTGGRKAGTLNKSTSAIKSLAQAHGEAAIDTLAQILTTGGEVARIAAARELLDRGYGKPQQGIDLAAVIETPSKPRTRAEFYGSAPDAPSRA